MTVRPGLGAPGVVTASDHRRSLSGLLVPAHATDPLVTRSGILPGPGNPLRVRQNSPLAMSVLVNAGVSEIYRTGRGPYAPTNDAVATVAITPAPGANSRWDLIYIAQADTEAGDANSLPTLTVATGSAVASPTKPYGLIPAGGYVLAEVGPILTSTTQITDALISNVSRFTAVRGAPIWVRTQAERDELTTLASLANPITVERLDTGQLERNAGSGWRPLGLVPAVTAKVTANVTAIVDINNVILISAPAVVGDGVKKFKITASARDLGGTVVTDLFVVGISGASLLAQHFVTLSSTSGGIFSDGLSLWATDIPAAGARVYSFHAALVVGSGTGTVHANATAPIEIIVEQIA